MGIVKHNLAKENFAIEPYFKNDLRLEVSEAIHLHWRDIRILLTIPQWEEFYDCMVQGYKGWTGGLHSIDVVLDERKLPNEILLDPVVSLEEQENGCIHFHYKDMRIEMPQDAFVKMAGIFEQARANYFKGRECNIDLIDIDPYDHIHKPTLEEWVSIGDYSREHLVTDFNDHISGIAWMANMIDLGFEIKPIIVTKMSDGGYKRRDGFKRYMAYKELNEDYIPCYVVSEEVALTMPKNKEFPFRGFK